MKRFILGALMAALLGACGAPEQQAPETAPRLEQSQAALSTVATYDSTLRTPRCSSVGTGCDSGTLLRGRASLGPEANAPNTLRGACADGTSGTYHADESLDQLVVETPDGTPLAPGKTVRIRATVWAWGSGSSDKLDLYTTGNADAPAWTFLTTLTPAAGGAQTLTATYTLPPGAMQAVRGIFRYGGSATTCGTGSYTDHDDLVFAVESGPTVRMTAPTAGAVLQNTANLAAEFSGPTAPARVSFYEGTRWLGDDTTAPYTHAWNTQPVPNGLYSLTARAFDSTGGTVATSAAVQVQVRNDQAAPTVRLTSPVAGAVLKGTVTLTASASDDVGVTRVEFYADGYLLGTAASASSPSLAWNTRTHPNGARALTVRAHDAAGNITTSSAVSVILDNDWVSPTVSIVSPTSGQLTPNPTPVTVSASDNLGLARLEVSVDGPLVCNLVLNGELSATRTCNVSSTTGTHNVQVRAWDLAGNPSALTFVSFTMDASPPAVSITSPAAGATVSGTVTVGVSVTDNQAVARTELYVGSQQVATRTAAPFDLSWDTLSASNGGKSLQVWAYDTAGNLTKSDTRSVTVLNDVTPPSVSFTSPAPGQEIFSGMRINASAQDNDKVTLLEIFVDGAVIFSNSFAGNPSVTVDFMWNSAGVGEGFHTLTARARDAAGNVGVSPARGFYVDRTPPQVSITSLSNGQQVTGLVEVDVVASDDRGIRRVELVVDGWDVTSAVQAPYRMYWDTRMHEEGPHQVRVLAYDTAGNITRSQTLEIVVANGAPPVVQLVSPAGGTVDGVVQVEATASADVGIAQVDFWLDTQLLGTATTPPYVITWDSETTPSGTYQLRAVAVSTTGRTTASEPVFLTLDNDLQPPNVHIHAPSEGMSVSGSVTVVVPAWDDVGITRIDLLVDGAPIMTTLSHHGDFPWDTRWHANGTHTLTARAWDASGKMGQSQPVTVTVFNNSRSGQAEFDPNLRAPGCANIETECDSGVLLVGSGTEGFEPQAPNTLNNSCGDADAEGFHTASTIDRLVVSNGLGYPMTSGEWVSVQLNVFTTSPEDVIDVYAADDAWFPQWNHVATLLPSYSGPQQLHTSFQLPYVPYGGFQAVRAVLRRGGAPSACAAGVVMDHDDLFFAVQ